MGTTGIELITSAVGKLMLSPLNFHTSHTTISAFLGGFKTFSVPDFQRDYAWDDRAVKVFERDIERCRCRQIDSDPRPHFFGAVVTCPSELEGTSRPHHIVIDGQQRLATIFLLVAALRRKYLEAAQNLNDNGATREAAEYAAFFKGRAENLVCNFERTRDIRFMTRKSFRKLRLNTVDDPYFARLLAGEEPKETRASHSRLNRANRIIEDYLLELLQRSGSYKDTQRILDTLYKAFLRDLHIVHLSADSNRQANLIYRVLNSRGIPVSNCDLLRASTLDFASSKLDAGGRASITGAWDEILTGSGMEPDEALAAAFFSRTGICGLKDQLIDQIEEKMFPDLLEDRKPTESEANKTLRAVCLLRDDISDLSKIAVGEICQGDHTVFTPVFKSRFEALTVVLKQYYCFPLIHAATVLGPDKYVRVCDLVERFAFRYGVVARAPIHMLIPIFERHIGDLRDSPESFRIEHLRQDFSKLISDFCNDDLFKERLRDMEYGRGTKKPLRYALVMIEHMFHWCNNNPQGMPVCRDTTRVIDFKTITLEHIVPTNAPNIDSDLRPFVNSIGNLTVMSQAENDTAANRSFEQKRPIFESSSLAMNREIAKHQNWDVSNYRRRENDLLARLLAIFSI